MMSNDKDQLTVNQEELVNAWNRTLPTILNSSDKAEVKADAADAKTLRIAIQTAGRTDYSFDFKCTYVDSREIKTELIDVEIDGIHVDEKPEVIQTLIEDYVRHLNECAQNLQQLTHH